MKIFNLHLTFLFLVSLVVASNWSKEDYEIFSLNDKIQQDLGKETTFYSWLDLERGPKATRDEINKAYRKLSRKLHPDKYSKKSRKEKKNAEDRFQRLSLVGNILRDKSLKRRYDYFYDKGFPKWKGTGYYYSKFRPGVVFTFAILYIIVGTFQYISLRINRKQDYKRILDLKNELINQAWGGSPFPPAGITDRKIVNQANEKEFVVTPTGNVFLVDAETKELIELDENDINLKPGFKESMFYKIPVCIYNLSVGKWISKPIDTTITYVNPKRAETQEAERVEKKKARKKAQRGDKKIELPNGKVVYSRKK
ncbi:uncharacterized protein SPAPADRAFT_54369 [Spathaspora passalidarum NRRL Y-27907]|uniref:J domain-containing protein n=1 Tax=Spathaspora passalidarum (strain NRRL Y-27907 / 11-Y1) TaxID=619300 RepID=G3AHN1_SPAPN|nr:uncharacterized protein SPAPADRAFT_54369 [Spathaspora passalidarum NRRL Y-27907]EGW34195.1 hypothetical protein SPAPADRAFT_54369 [Spathaspora passalidarum NRRL Y-27907]